MKCYSYSLIVEKAFGRAGRVSLDFMIFSTQYTFTIASIVFQANSIRDLVVDAFGEPLTKIGRQELFTKAVFPDMYSIWTYTSVVIVILTLLAWVRNIAVFRFTFIFANFLLLSSIIIVIGYSIDRLKDLGLPNDIVAVNTSGMWTNVGFAIYTFEGIGILMPCMQACEVPDEFDNILIKAVITVTSLFLVYGTMSYVAYGNMEEQMVT